MRESVDESTDIGARTRWWLWTVSLGCRLVVFAIGAIAVSSPAYVATADAAPPVSENRFVDLPYRWDAEWYLSIARDGYTWTAERRQEQQSIAFFPAYPVLMRATGDALTIIANAVGMPATGAGDDARVIWSGVLLSLICLGFAAERVYALAMLDIRDRARAGRAVILLACYPFALFLGVPYSESLSLLAIASTVLAWRQGDMRTAAAWGVVTGLARSSGWTLSAALLADWCLRWTSPTRTATRAAAALAPIAGTALYCAYVFRLTGNPFEWVVAQRAWVGYPGVLDFVARRAQSVMQLGPVNHVRSDSVDAIAVACVVIMLALAVWMLLERHFLYAAVIVCYMAPALAVDLSAKGRITAVLFPAFIALARLTGRTAFVLVATVFALGQAWLAWLFFQWRPPY